MNITLSARSEQYIRELIESGRFPDENSAIDAAVRFLQIKLKEADACDMPEGVAPDGKPWTTESLRAAVKVGVDQANRKQFVEFDADSIMRRVEDQLERERLERERGKPEKKVG